MIDGAAIDSAAGSVFGGRLYPNTAPQGAVHPFCIYQYVGGIPSNTFCGETEKQNARIQFWVWSKRADEAFSLMESLTAALTGTTLKGVAIGGPVSQYDSATRTHGFQRDFSFWA